MGGYVQGNFPDIMQGQIRNASNGSQISSSSPPLVCGLHLASVELTTCRPRTWERVDRGWFTCIGA